MTTIGEMIAALFDRYEERYGDARLAAFATRDRVNDALDRSRRSALRTVAYASRS